MARILCLSLLPLILGSFLPQASLSGRVYSSGQLLSQALVSVEGLRYIPDASPANVALNHTGGKFVPSFLAVLVGTRVEFQSSPGMPCRLYSITRSAKFNLRRQAGRTKSVKFDDPGLIEVRCADHPSSRACILVKENPYFAFTNASGEYTIAGVPTGQHLIRVWVDGQALETKTVQLGPTETLLDFHLDLGGEALLGLAPGQEGPLKKKENN